MNIKEVMEGLALKFKSGNDVPVTRATITRKEYEEILNYINEGVIQGRC